MEPRVATLAKKLKAAKKLAKQHDGKIPNSWWLITHDHEALYRYMLRHPSYFKHIECDVGTESKKGVTYSKAICQKYMGQATRITKQKGFLPPCRWLETHGHRRLAQYMGNHLPLFSHLLNKKKRKTV